MAQVVRGIESKTSVKGCDAFNAKSSGRNGMRVRVLLSDGRPAMMAAVAIAIPDFFVKMVRYRVDHWFHQRNSSADPDAPAHQVGHAKGNGKMHCGKAESFCHILTSIHGSQYWTKFILERLMR